MPTADIRPEVGRPPTCGSTRTAHSLHASSTRTDAPARSRPGPLGWGVPGTAGAQAGIARAGAGTAGQGPATAGDHAATAVVRAVEPGQPGLALHPRLVLAVGDRPPVGIGLHRAVQAQCRGE